MSGTPSQPATPAIRVITAASLFDGHDAAINIMRRILLSQGAEVIHLGHDRSVLDIAEAAVEEDAHAVAVSSYQGGHMEFFTYLVEMLAQRGRGDIQVFGGGGGTITDKEIDELHRRGVAWIYSVEDGRRLGLAGMIGDLLDRAARPIAKGELTLPDGYWQRDPAAVARVLTEIEWTHEHRPPDEAAAALRAFRERIAESAAHRPPVLGMTGVGGAGKSSLADEIVRRLLERFDDRTVAVLSVDPSRRRSGGALLGDRIRMNSVTGPRVLMRSMATRKSHAAVPVAVADALLALQGAGYDLVILETAGIGQSSTEVVDLCDVSLYVMTPEFGAPSQLEKIDMLDYADLVALNKADKRGAEDALQYVRKQVRQNRNQFDRSLSEMPVFPCVASRFGDGGVDRLFHAITERIDARAQADWTVGSLQARSQEMQVVVPARRERYLSEIADRVRDHRERGGAQADIARRADGLRRALVELGDDVPSIGQPYPAGGPGPRTDAVSDLRARYDALIAELDDDARQFLQSVPQLRERYQAPENAYAVRGREIRVRNFTETLAGTAIPKVALPGTEDWGELVAWHRNENIPGEFPYAAGVFPYKRTGEDPTRMFAGEGTPERTNRRFHYLSAGQPAVRLSTAFDSVTLYGRDPESQPDVYGKVGNSGVSVATLDDAKRLYSGFDLSSPTTSVSMTINGPAPMVLAMFFNTAIDQAVERRLQKTGRWQDARTRAGALAPDGPSYRGDLPEGHNGAGLGLLGVSGDLLVPAEEYAEIRAATLSRVRGTVQADILKEDQAQNTCIFSTDFALKMMGDIQAYFTEHDVRNFYSVSISGYHIAEAGANPITQLALTLANGFTYVEYYRARGLDVDRFARNLSFFFSNGVDAEYAVIGRVARRIWAVAMRDLYGAGPRSQQLKYHIQTSGRSLHAQEIDFNDIRTTLQALYAICDNCNSLHTNAYDEAITTPTEASVRRALAIQLIINRELGLAKNENPLQGAYFIELLTRQVEEAVLAEFDRITERGGVLGAMEVMYQRSKIQEESLLYEHKKHSGELPIVGVNTFLAQSPSEGVVETELIRATEAEKADQIQGVEAFQHRGRDRAATALERLRRVAYEGGNIFGELMETVKSCSLGQISQALFEVGGQYRRSM